MPLYEQNGHSKYSAKKMDIINNYCETLICGYLFNFSLKL